MRTPRLGRLVNDLIGRSEHQLVRIVDDQIRAALDGARLSLLMADGQLPTADARVRMAAVEHRGDEERGRLVAALAGTLATPVDREDLFRLSRCVDDVLDNLRDFVRESDLYGPDRQPHARPLLVALTDGLTALESATAALLAARSGTDAVLAAKKAAGRIRQCYQLELADLFTGPLDMQTLGRRELLRRLDVAGLRLGEAADALADGVLKRGR